jgi:hypothetical protein
MKAILSAQQPANRTMRALGATADCDGAAQARSYFKPDQETEFYGVSASGSREIERILCEKILRGEIFRRPAAHDALVDAQAATAQRRREA